ncbi:coiled-coil domain-containing protein 73 [Nerophis lumbriciformis]|uniref:coiled-coil domain-containing protein 73 n=1 Tax=Nerophis lumbriciformis TaxID=546530 RepID=UPI003BA967EF
MDHSMDCRALSPSVAVSGAATPQERSPLNNPCQVESGGTILLQLLEFKTHLLEAVEELHIRRDAESRFEDQISKVVLEKQELEWEKESLQHQIETVENQHAQSLIDTKKQATIRHTEEEKGRYKVMAELKEKEISNLKEELKSLQLLKYNLEKKSNELEQKLNLQIRSKDSHLNQLGEVEKRFKALSRQCASVKKAHEKLEQNVDEAMRINKKLAASNEKHEGTIETLKKELDLANTQLIKAKMSSVRHDQTYKSQTHTEQHLQQLRQTLSMETEMNKRLRDEYAAVRSEKQEVMKSTQYTQQLLLSQTKTVSRLELQLQAQDEQYKALKQEHEVMREKCKAMEDKVIELMNEQQDFQALKEAHDDLQHKHTELSSQVKVQVQNIHEMFPTLAEEIRGRPPDEPQSSAMLHVFGSQQNSAVSENKILDCLEDTTAKNKLDGETGGYEAPNPHVKSQAQLQAQCEMFFSVQTKRPLGTSEKTGSDDNLLNLHTSNYNISESMSNEVSDLTCTTFHQSGYELATSEIISESSANIINKSNADCMSSIPILTKDKNIDDSTSFVGADYHWTDTANEESNIREDVEINTNQQRNTEDLLEKGYAGQPSEKLNSQTVERVNSQDDSEKSKQEYKTETTSACMVIGEEKGKTEKEKEAQTTHDKKSNTPPDIDFMEKIVNVCDTNCNQKDMKKVAYYSPINTNKGHLLQDVQSPTDQSLSNGSIIVVHKVQSLCQGQVQTNVAYIESTPTAAYRVVEKTPEDKRIDESSPKVFEPLSESSVSLTIPSLTELSNSSSNVTHTNEMGGTDTHEKLDDTKMVSHSRSTIEEANRLMEETCETGLHLETVSYDGDLNISNQYNTADSKMSKCVLSESIQLKGGNDNSLGVSATECHKPTVVKETHGDVKELSLPKTHMHCVGSIKQKILPTAITGSILHPNVQNFPVPKQNTSGSGGLLTESPYTTFLKNQHSKVPLVITRAADLLSASGVSGYTAFARRFQQGAQSVFGESRQTKTSAADDSKVSLTTPTCQASSFSNTLPWQLPSVSLSRPPVPSHGSRSELEFEPLCSQEEHQSSLRAQISKIEHFLETERLHLPKRPRTEN